MFYIRRSTFPSARTCIDWMNAPQAGAKAPLSHQQSLSTMRQRNSRRWLERGFRHSLTNGLSSLEKLCAEFGCEGKKLKTRSFIRRRPVKLSFPLGAWGGWAGLEG